MEMYSPVKGQLCRTHHDGVHVKFAMSERDYSVYAKVGYIQVSNLPFNTFLSVVICMAGVSVCRWTTSSLSPSIHKCCIHFLLPQLSLPTLVSLS